MAQCSVQEAGLAALWTVSCSSMARLSNGTRLDTWGCRGTPTQRASSTSTRLLHTWTVINSFYTALTLTLCVFNWICKNPHSAFAHFINKLMIGQEYLKKTIYSPPVHWFLNTRNGSQALHWFVYLAGSAWPESLHAMLLKQKLCLGITVEFIQ